MNLIIGADLVPTISNYNEFSNGDMESLLDNELMMILNNADYRVFNLEVPLTNSDKSIKKHGPCLKAGVESINGLKKINVDLFSLANNHIMDYGVKGLESTIDILNENKISYIGVGNNIDDASKAIVCQINGKTIGFYACVESEFSIALDNYPGANPFDPLYSLDHISELKEKSDYVIVLYHGGKEYYRYPAPYLQKRCRKIIDKGADLVICQHSHCIGCKEEYKNREIIYGQGNFLFDDEDDIYWQTGMLVQIDDSFNVSYIPIKKNGKGVRLANEKEKQEILSEFYSRSMEICNKDFVEKEYMKFALSKEKEYYRAYFGRFRKNILLKIIDKLSGYHFIDDFFLKKNYELNDRLILENYVECEAHRDLFLTSLKWRRKIENDKKNHI